MSTKELPTAAVVSVASGRLACDIGQIYDVLDWVLDDALMTHQLPNASRAVQPFLEVEFPWLTELDLPEGGGADFTEAVFALVDLHGATLEVPQWDAAPWVQGNAMADLEVIAAGRPIIDGKVGQPKPDVQVVVLPDVSDLAASFDRLSAAIDPDVFKRLAEALDQTDDEADSR